MSYLLFFYSNTLISISPSSLVTSVLRFGPYLHMIILVPTKHSCTRSYKNRVDFPPLAVRSLSPSESVFSPLSELSAFRDQVELRCCLSPAVLIILLPSSSYLVVPKQAYPIRAFRSHSDYTLARFSHRKHILTRPTS